METGKKSYSTEALSDIVEEVKDEVYLDPLDKLTDDVLEISRDMWDELERANGKYSARFNSSLEILGVIRDQYLNAEDLLRIVKIINGVATDNDTNSLSPFLKDSLVRLGAMCIKAIQSLPADETSKEA